MQEAEPRSNNLQGVWIDQNYPNPVSESTTLNYSIPPGTQAQILIYELSSGTLVRSFHADASGKLTFSAAGLKPGTYTYSLVVEGKVVDSKKLMIK